MKKKHIMHIIYSLSVGGLENGVVNLVNNFKNDHFKNSICCLNGGGKLEKKLSEYIEVYKMYKKRGHDWFLMLKLSKLLKEKRPTIVHTRNWAGIDAIFCAKIAKVPIIVHGEHGFEITDLKYQNRKRNFIRKIVFSKLVDKIITVSKNLKFKLINDLGINPNKIVYIPNGVDINKFNPKNKKLTKKKFGLKKDDFVIGIVARLDPIKNHENLILAFKKISSINHQSKLLIVGDGPLRQHLQHLSHQLGVREKILFMGERSDVPQILKCFDVFVLPSLNEGMSNTILEAMATGIPVIASNVGGNPELVIDGQTGFLFSPKDVDDLVNKIKFYIFQPDLIYKHGLNGRKRIEKEFSLFQMVKKYENLYLELSKKNLNL